MKQTIYKHGKVLRYGYTTGSCAAGATKASVEMLLSGKKVEHIELLTPKGWTLNLDINGQELGEVCSSYVIKDSGDDPDITHKIKVYSSVKKIESGIVLKGGIGVGKVTKEGLQIPVGEPAINPVPRKMIKENVEALFKKYHYTGGVEITISIPEGVEIAKKTFNPRLGIMGGISVIGTTGIVEPMSEEAFKDSLRLELSMLKSENVVLAPGNYGTDYCISRGITQDKIVKTSNFIGYMFERAVETKKKNVLFVGHIGKLIKVAGGIYHTHSRMADCRMDILVSHLVQVDAEIKHLKAILECNTTEEAVVYIYDHNLERVFNLVVNNIKEKLENYVYGDLTVEVLLFSQKKGLLAKTAGADKMMEII